MRTGAVLQWSSQEVLIEAGLQWAFHVLTQCWVLSRCSYSDHILRAAVYQLSSDFRKLWERVQWPIADLKNPPWIAFVNNVPNPFCETFSYGATAETRVCGRHDDLFFGFYIRISREAQSSQDPSYLKEQAILYSAWAILWCIRDRLSHEDKDM